MRYQTFGGSVEAIQVAKGCQEQMAAHVSVGTLREGKAEWLTSDDTGEIALRLVSPAGHFELAREGYWVCKADSGEVYVLSDSAFRATHRPEG